MHLRTRDSVAKQLVSISISLHTLITLDMESESSVVSIVTSIDCRVACDIEDTLLVDLLFGLEFGLRCIEWFDVL